MTALTFKIPPRYNLSAPPAETVVGVQFTEAEAEKLRAIPVKFSKARIPAVGERIEVTMNGLGFGEVVGYFVEAGWLGVYAALEKPPAWRAKQGVPISKPAMVFGSEIKFLEDR